jgi:predicted nucleic acid-binding protein
MKIYFDTNFIRDVSEKRNNKATHLMETIRKLTEKKKVTCYTSLFLLMELSDTKKDDLFFLEAINKKWEFKKIMRERGNPCLEEHHFKKISEYTDNLEETYSFLNKLLLSEEGWQVALSISSYSNIWSSDAIHLATALSNDCDLLITSDSQFNKEANKIVRKFKQYGLRIVEVEEAQKIVEEELK